MADIYVNLGSQDVQYAMDKIDETLPQSPMPPAGVDQAQMLNANKSKRLLKVKVIDPEGDQPEPVEDAQKPGLNLPNNVVRFPGRARPETGSSEAGVQRPNAGVGP
jgi:hypothetical protein